MPSSTFPSSKSWFTTLMIWGTAALLLVLFVRESSSSMALGAKIALGLFFGLVSGLLLWTWFCTYYRISGEWLYYRCGPLHGAVPIQKIKKIKLNHYLWSGLRPALGLHGLVLFYKRWDEIYFSPAEEERFIKALREINPEIVVENEV